MPTDPRLPGDDLRLRLDASKRYWDSEGRDGAPLVMPGSDLSLLDLREQNLAGAQLQGADLRGALLDSAVLVRSDLDGARLAGASLYGANASKASLVNAELVGIQAPRSRWRRATLTKSDLTAARLDDADFTGADMIDARLDRASILNCVFAGAVLLGASLREVDLDNASFDNAVLDPSLAGRISDPVHGRPAVALSKPARRRSESERDLEVSVRKLLTEHGLAVMSGLNPGPDLVVELAEYAFAALEVSISASQTRLFRLAERADLIVVPDDLDVRAAMNGTPVAHLSAAERAVRQLELSEVKSYGAVAVAIREANRLRPYAALQSLVESDPTAMSRISVYIDTHQEFLLTSRDRSIARALPAHLDGAMASRAREWASQHANELIELLAAAAAMRRSEPSESGTAARWARRGLEMEEELSAYARRQPA